VGPLSSSPENLRLLLWPSLKTGLFHDQLIGHFFNALDIAVLIVLEKMSLGVDQISLYQWITDCDSQE